MWNTDPKVRARRWYRCAAVSPRVGPMGSSSVRRPADLDIVRKSYDRVADNYVDMVATTGLGDIRTHPWLQAAMDVFADAVGGLGPVLDIGCGPGTVTAYLADRGVDVSGVDLSPRMIKHARRLYPKYSFSVASSTDLDLADSSLGGVLGWWSLFNLPRDVLPQVLSSFAPGPDARRTTDHRDSRGGRRCGSYRSLWRCRGQLDDLPVATGTACRAGRTGRTTTGG